MTQALLVILYLIAAALLIPLIGALSFWLKGANVIALPGFGILIATPLLVAVLAVAETGAIFCAAYCVRYLPAVRMLFDEWPSRAGPHEPRGDVDNGMSPGGTG